MTVYQGTNGNIFAHAGQTFRNGVNPHPLQRAGVVPHTGTAPRQFSLFHGRGAPITHAISLIAKQGGNEGSGSTL